MNLLLTLYFHFQVNSLPATLDEFVSNFDEWYEQTTEEIINKFNDDEPQTFGITLLEQTGTLKCYQQELGQLVKLRRATLTEFFQCDRLKEGFKDIGQILVKTFNISADVLKNLLSDLSECTGNDKLSQAICVVKAFWNVKGHLTDFKLYKQEVVNLAKEVREIFQYCATHHEPKLNEKVETILKETKLCH